MTELPPPYEDELEGACIRHGETTLLLTGSDWQATTAALKQSAQVMLSGQLALRYAVHFEGLDDALIPQLVVDDHQVWHAGHELLRFIAAKGNAYPRADAIGVRLSGQDDHVFLRELDLARPFMVMAHSPEYETHEPVRVQIAALVDQLEGDEGWQSVARGDAALPDLLVRHAFCVRVDKGHLGSLSDYIAEWTSAATA